MFPGIDALACPNLAVPAQVMRHVVRIESNANPFAIGVVGARLVRQPRTLEEAVATAQMLESGGYNYSLGAAQVNRVNLRKYGLDNHRKAFDFCTNLAAGASILAHCYASADGDWGKAFSCYYSGNFVTGFRSGYVQKVFDSISRDQTVAEGRLATGPVPPRAAASVSTTPTAPAPKPPEVEQPTAAAPRISMRAVPLGASAPPPPAAVAPGLSSAPTSPPSTPPSAIARPDVFVPQVRRPAAVNTPAPPAPASSPGKPGGDDAFVF
ncbi:lytic transglycosylase domain-containing protein [Variovorax sp. J2P1-31]|uniref:lytic transglycosylase domain-containing protein n=1 Tax=Variovorax sp. J2P1-31 TaxID=3053497 RepID=UPI002578E5B9|nr:lytic transglycosylase domain-containing protein [Variovorax sp. J2P1-31]MDM0090478.1 lytic transglycosylase domain-containing protein [Variovorax sp. J22G40]MDM0147857.1 lytic transglycosylase domain-containing protein [Variovorax sp. J2P1-31]